MEVIGDVHMSVCMSSRGKNGIWEIAIKGNFLLFLIDINHGKSL